MSENTRAQDQRARNHYKIMKGGREQESSSGLLLGNGSSCCNPCCVRRPLL